MELLNEEVDLTKHPDFPTIEIDIKSELTEEIKRQLNSKILSLKTDEEKELYKQSIIFFNKGENEENNKWVDSWVNREFIKKTIKEKKSPFIIFEKEGQARRFIEEQPLFYDRGDLFWLWNFDLKKWEIKDKVDILNGIKQLGINTINSKERTEILNALQQVGRENLPKELPKECIQFLDKIINIKTGEEFESTPEYFGTNPIPYKVGLTDETPTMDRLFEEWVGKKYSKTLYQILAYSACSNQFMQRMFALVGGGSNGKGTFIKLLRKFVGSENCVTSELNLLSSNQFETSSLYKKLVCEIGEVSQDDLKSTNQIKKLSGENEMRYCFKGKTPFTDDSPTTCLINTNSLPTTTDKNTGFYRRWLIIDFPNQFPIKEGIIHSIPEIEFENLARKCIKLLKEMYKTQKFENEGDYQERMERYEERSNPIMRFIELHCEEEFEAYISLKKFGTSLNDYLKYKHLRIMSPKEIKKKLNDEGFDVRKGTKDYKTDTYIYSLKLKNIPNIPNIPKNEIQSLRKNQISENGIFGIFGIKTQILDYFKDLDSKDEFFKITDEVKSKFNLTETEIRDILTELLSEGLIYEPRKDVWRYLG